MAKHHHGVIKIWSLNLMYCITMKMLNFFVFLDKNHHEGDGSATRSHIKGRLRLYAALRSAPLTRCSADTLNHVCLRLTTQIGPQAINLTEHQAIKLAYLIQINRR